MVGFAYIIVLLTVLSLEFIDRYHSLFIVFCYIVYLIARSIYLHPSDINFPKEQIKEFLAGRWKWFKRLRALKQAYLIIAGIIGITLLILFLRLYLELFLFEWNDPKIKDNSIRDLAIAFFGTISGIGALFGVYLAILRSEENTRQNIIANEQSQAAHRQAKTAEEGLITDRINKATEGLGKSDKDGDPIVELRLGALYALERIAQDSIRDHIQIMEILCAYIRHNSLKNKADKTKEPTEDIQTALTIIGRRDTWPEGKKYLKKEEDEGYYLELGDCYLYGADFYRANLRDAWFYEADLRNVNFIHTNLIGAWLNGANMSYAITDKAEMNGTNLMNVYAYTGDFSNCPGLTKEQIKEMFLGIHVAIPEGWQHPQEGTDYYKDYDTFEDFFTAYKEWMKTR